MPAQARKSSLGTTRRGPQKYIPYRADDFQRGKRTGIQVGVVEANSDDFEPFEEVIKQADVRTPPRPKLQRKKKPKTPIVEEDDFDENGEMDMELEDSTPNSPAMYFSNARLATLSSVQRSGSTSRPLSRGSNADFDEIPSPRRPMSALSNHRRSFIPPRSPSGPSRLSLSTVPQDLADGLDIEDNFSDGGFDPPEPIASDDEPIPSPSPAPSRKRTVSQMSRDVPDEDEDEDEEDVQTKTPTSPKAKGKQRQVNPDPPEEDQEMEDIQDFGGDTNLEPPDVEEDREATPKPKKGRGKAARKENVEVKERPKPQRRGKENVLRELIHDDNRPDDDGPRRGQRTRYAPLEWWRLEKVVYGRRGSGPCLVPAVKEIHRIPKEVPGPLGGKKSRKRSRATSKTVEPMDELVSNPEEDWDMDTEEMGVVIDYEKQEEVEKRVAFTQRMLELKPALGNEFYFQKVFGDGNFIAAGEILIPPHKQKPTKHTKDNTFVFFVIDGTVNFKVHRTSFVLTTGGMFLVPRGNIYYIQNVSDREAKLFFAQARKMTEYEQDAETDRGLSGSREASKDRRSESMKRAPAEVDQSEPADVKVEGKKRAATRS